MAEIEVPSGPTKQKTFDIVEAEIIELLGPASVRAMGSSGLRASSFHYPRWVLPAAFLTFPFGLLGLLTGKTREITEAEFYVREDADGFTITSSGGNQQVQYKVLLALVDTLLARDLLDRARHARIKEQLLSE